MDFKDVLSRITSLILVIGLFMIGGGLALWLFGVFQDYQVGWQLQLVAFGLVLLTLGVIAIKLFQD